MAHEPSEQPIHAATVAVPVELTVFGGMLRASVPVPAGLVRPREMLPIMRTVAEAVIHLSVRSVERQGKSISCKEGCGACCRQFVPVAECEARLLIELVENLPEPKRSEVRKRFEDAVTRITDAGLRDPLMSPESQPRERMKGIGVEYFRLGIACPFLENESCSIYAQRPIICREYMVTSPPERCTTLTEIDGLPLPYRASLAACRVDEKPTQILVRTVPLTMIFEWAKTACAEPGARPGKEIMEEFLRYLARSGG